MDTALPAGTDVSDLRQSFAASETEVRMLLSRLMPTAVLGWKELGHGAHSPASAYNGTHLRFTQIE